MATDFLEVSYKHPRQYRARIILFALGALLLITIDQLENRRAYQYYDLFENSANDGLVRRGSSSLRPLNMDQASTCHAKCPVDFELWSYGGMCFRVVIPRFSTKGRLYESGQNYDDCRLY